jgi:hypothetical protein
MERLNEGRVRGKPVYCFHMTKAGQDELDLLGRYKWEAADLDRRIAEMTARRKTLDSAMRGLRDVLLSRGVAESVVDAAPDPKLRNGVGGYGPRRRLTTIDHAVNVLAASPQPLGVQEIKNALRGTFSIQYSALSKALNREAARPDGRIVKDHSAFRQRI